VAAPPTRIFTGEARTGASLWSQIPLWLLVFATFSAAGLLQFASVDWERPLTIYDEVPHIDYTFRLADGSITTWDDVYSQRTLGIAECLEIASDNPQCIYGELRDPQERWPNGYSYEALQAPIGYLPFALADVVTIDEQGDHYSQIRQLRFVNVGLWLLFAAAWTMLIVQVTSNRLAAAAASTIVALNPLLFDRFTYVTNDGPAIIASTATSAWLIFGLRDRTLSWPRTIIPALAIGIIVGLLKPTALIVLLPLLLAGWASVRFADSTRPPMRWWLSVVLIGATGAVASFAYSAYIEARSSLDFHTVLSVILPRGPLGLADASVLRLEDISELVTGSGARNDAVTFEWGLRSPTVWVLAFAVLGASAFLVSLTLRNAAFDRIPTLDARVLGISVVVGFIAVLIAHPALHYVRGEFLMPFTSGRFQAPLIPLAGLVVLPAFVRFRGWAWVAILGGLLVAAFAS